MIRAVLLDAAGTLIEPRERVGETYARIAAQLGLRVGADRLDAAFQRARAASPALPPPGATGARAAAAEREAWRAFVGETFRAAEPGLRPADLDACFEALWRHYADASAWRLRPGAAAALAALRAAGRRLAVVSNFDHRLPAILEGLGLGALLDAVVLPGVAGAAKPSAAIFRCALSRLAVAASEAVVVGDDRERDLDAARALGLAAIDAASLATLAELPDRIATLEAGGPS